jgi:hypothetical protein
MARANRFRQGEGKGERASKITVVLLRRQTAALDQLKIAIRLRHGAPISRAEIISGLIVAATKGARFARPVVEPRD